MSDLAQAIHDSGYKIVLAVTGGGIGAIHDLLRTSGASRSILEATIPYASEALTELLGGRPDQFCSSATSRAMAMAAFQRARCLAYESKSETAKLLGIGCTASLASDHPKQGQHRVHVAVQSATATAWASVTLAKGRRTRREEDHVASTLLMRFLHARAIDREFTWSTGFVDEPIETQLCNAPLGWQKLLGGECCWTNRDGSQAEKTLLGSNSPLAIYCGAFHPRHAGHEQIARIGAQRFGRVVHEISIRNVDKLPLDFLEMSERAAQFTAEEEIVFSSAPTFVEKAKIFPGCVFLVGVDTIRRIAQPIYYGGEKERDAAIDQLAQRGCRFLVFGRLIEGKFEEFSSADVTPKLAELCDVVSEREFRLDISSTVLRSDNGSS